MKKSKQNAKSNVNGKKRTKKAEKKRHKKIEITKSKETEKTMAATTIKGKSKKRHLK